MNMSESSPRIAQALLGDVHRALGGELRGDAALVIEGIRPLLQAGPSDISFLAHERYASQLAETRAGAVIVSAAMADKAQAPGRHLIVIEQPYVAFARLTQWWAARRRRPAAIGVHPSAVIDPSAVIGSQACIGPGVVVGRDVIVGERARIEAHCVLGDGVRLGDDAHLSPNVTVYEDCRLGDRVRLHSGVVIGADGFGFAQHEGQWIKIEQLGAVVIGDDVEVGANTCIDRGALDDTRIGDGVILDNLIQIGHNVQIGKGTAIAGCAGVAGSAVIGERCTIGGGAVVLGHLSLADGVHISAASVVTRSIQQPGQYSGFYPLDQNAAWERSAAVLRNLPSLRERLRALERWASTQNS